MTSSTVPKRTSALYTVAAQVARRPIRSSSCRARVRDQQIKCIPRAISMHSSMPALHRCELPRPQSPNLSHAMASDPYSRGGDSWQIHGDGNEMAISACKRGSFN